MRDSLIIVCLITVTNYSIDVRATDEPAMTSKEQTYSLKSAGIHSSDKSMIKSGYQPYMVYSKDVGWDGIDIIVKELERQESSSLFYVPNYTERTAIESRFAMCAFPQATLLRGFTHWLLSARPQGDSNRVWVGFYSASPDDEANKPILLPGRKEHPGAALFSETCQFFDPSTGETSSKSLNTETGDAGAG